MYQQQLQTALALWLPSHDIIGMGWRRCFQVSLPMLSLTSKLGTCHSPRFSRTVYFFLKESPLQFKVCSIFQLSIDLGARLLWRIDTAHRMSAIAIVIQGLMYGSPPPETVVLEVDDIEQALALDED
jgi:hypothetical protein